MGRLFEVRSLPGKGLGVVAICDIPQGTELIREAPLMRIYKTDYTAEDLDTVFSTLDPDVQGRIMQLASAHGQDSCNYPAAVHDSDAFPDADAEIDSRWTATKLAIGPPRLSNRSTKRERRRDTDRYYARLSSEPSLMSRVLANAFNLGDSSGILDKASRFNHSCIANATFNYLPEAGVIVIHSTKLIKAGEEICVSYIDVYQLPESRRWNLQGYGFDCSCPACVDDGSGLCWASRERRWRLIELCERRADKYQDDSDAIRDLIEEIGLLLEEGSITLGLPERYLMLARVCAKRGDFALATKAARKAKAWSTICVGHEAAYTEDTAKAAKLYAREAAAILGAK